MPQPLLAKGTHIGNNLRPAVIQALQVGRRHAVGNDALAIPNLLSSLALARAQDVAADVEISGTKSQLRRKQAGRKTAGADAWDTDDGLSTDSDGWCTE